MNTYFTKTLAALGLTALLAAPAHAGTGILTRPSSRTKSSELPAQGSVLNKDIIVAPETKTRPSDGPIRGKASNKDIIVDPATRPAAGSRIKDVKLAHAVQIRQFTARRESSRIAMTAILGNGAKQTGENVSYRFSRMERGRWITVNSGKVTVPGGGSSHVSAEMPPTNDHVKLKIDVITESPYAYSTKGFALPAMTTSFVLKYGTNDWVLAYERKGEVDNQKLRNTPAKKRAAQLAEYGFESKISTKTTTGVFTDTEVVRLWVRTSTIQTRSFDTAEEALEFARGMKSLIHDSVAVWSRVEPE
jgi:hypothetical protein